MEIHMNTQVRKLLIASAIATTFGAAAPAFAGDASQEVTEARQETQIWTTYALSPYLRASDLGVHVNNGKATLTGNVEEGVSKDLAKQIALGVSGVKEVDNQIVVTPDYTPPARTSTDRSYGEVIDDATITAAIKSKLLWSSNADGMATDVDTKSGKVLLTGTADSGASKALAGRLALNTRGVAGVDNQLVVRPAKPSAGDAVKASAHEAGKDISDSWITAKVKSTFLYSSNVDGADISVATNAGVVTLTGKVDSGAERELAIELAKNVRGVKTVHSKGLTI
jgi:hyperosmotically inducible protein